MAKGELFSVLAATLIAGAGAIGCSAALSEAPPAQVPAADPVVATDAAGPAAPLVVDAQALPGGDATPAAADPPTPQPEAVPTAPVALPRAERTTLVVETTAVADAPPGPRAAAPRAKLRPPAAPPRPAPVPTGSPEPATKVERELARAASKLPLGLPPAGAKGRDPEDALGALMGHKVGKSFGYGGLGLRGTGRGGGGRASGSGGSSVRLGRRAAAAGSGILGAIGGRPSGVSRGRRAARRPRPASHASSRARHLVRHQRLRTVPAARLTATTVPDADRRHAYLSYLGRHPLEQSSLQLDMSRRVRFRVIDQGNNPIHDAAITLISGQGFQIRGRTLADGHWDLYPNVHGPDLGGAVQVFVQVGDETRLAQVVLPLQGDSRDIHIRIPQAAPRGPAALDLAFLIDVTGSMGDELDYVTDEVAGIVTRVSEAMPQVRIRVGATLYRDRQDRRPLQQIPFTEDVDAFAAHLGMVRARGGGDYPEDMNAGLAAAMHTQQWSQGSAARVLVLIADAPPKSYQTSYTYQHAMVDASSRGIRILPVAASGADRTVEFLLRAMGAFTATPYVYLTDDSGIGNPHMEADTDRITIEMFSDLLTRLLISDLQGRGMHEPEPRSVALPMAS